VPGGRERLLQFLCGSGKTGFLTVLALFLITLVEKIARPDVSGTPLGELFFAMLFAVLILPLCMLAGGISAVRTSSISNLSPSKLLAVLEITFAVLGYSFSLLMLSIYFMRFVTG